MKQIKTWAFSLCLIYSANSLAEKAPEVLTTVKPLQLIATAITAGVSEPQNLLPVNASPHDYQLKPSDMRKLKAADIIIWVGEPLEHFLQKPITQRSTAAQVITLSPTDPGGHEDEQAEDDQDDHHHHGSGDPHPWLSPIKAREFATQLAQSLIKLDPSNSSRYNDNLKQFKDRLTKTTSKITQQLEPVKSQGYFVFHDAYSGFEDYFQLNHLGAFTLSPERQPGAKHLNEIRQQLELSTAICLFAEPQFKPAIVKTISQGLDVKTATLDPLASQIEVSATGYFDFLQELADSFHQCLERK